MIITYGKGIEDALLSDEMMKSVTYSLVQTIFVKNENAKKATSKAPKKKYPQTKGREVRSHPPRK